MQQEYERNGLKDYLSNVNYIKTHLRSRPLTVDRSQKNNVVLPRYLADSNDLEKRSRKSTGLQ